MKLLEDNWNVDETVPVKRRRPKFMYQKGATFCSSLGNRHIEKWAGSGLVDYSQHIDTSTDVDTDHKIQFHRVQHGSIMVDSFDQSKLKYDDQKNRGVARKSIF
ncbi:hypothetical protein V6N13_037433 [Hibiscus sabdariffa]